MTNASDSEKQLNVTATPDNANFTPISGNVGAFKKAEGAAQVDQRLTELHDLLRNLEAITAANYTLPPVISKSVDNQLIQVRLGIASSLFAAVQCKHTATAGHSLRVALSCSAWAAAMGLDDSQRDALEIAALLHDIGVIGAPDQLLLNPGKLDENEKAMMLRARRNSVDILRPSCTSPEVLAIVENVSAWYDGTREGFMLSGPEIPLGARMIAIAEAFDAMTTDLVYRPARSHESAMAELFECAGAQFDPELVRLFADFHRGKHSALHQEVAQRWLGKLDPEQVNSYWSLSALESPPDQGKNGVSFEARLLESMYDAVVFIDAAGRIMFWNRGAERLTGISAASIRGRLWHPEMLQMSDEKCHPVNGPDCPVKTVFQSGVQSLRRATIVGRMDRTVAVDMHAIPVARNDGVMHGVILMFHDASSESTLEQRCLSLYDKATKDPLTQVANRAEFDRVHEMFVEVHQQRQMPCSLIICDLDRFKQVNDTYGHQAGDAAIKCLAAVLKSSCLPGDLVARYGGEEFVLLCTDCDNAAATSRAEQIRRKLSRLPQMKIGSRSVTASFGVTEIQPGDTPETMFRRADRALLHAKAKGRNCVVQLGAGSGRNQPQTKDKAKGRAADSPENFKLFEKKLITPVPVKIAVEKLRGFIADHNAKISSLDGNHLCLKIEDLQTSRLRRLTDRPTAFLIDLTIEEERSPKSDVDSHSSDLVRTGIRVVVTPENTRNRRRNDVLLRARELFISLRAYLMAAEDLSSSEKVWIRVGRILAPWLYKK
jgi:diguanylate cyclase (GGDEF)-like protein/PAS domain S-box-containing protein